MLVCGEIPDPRGIMIISLVDICGFWHSLLDPIEFVRLKRRIEQFAKMDFIGRAAARVIEEQKS